MQLIDAASLPESRGGHHRSDRRLRVLPMVAGRCRRNAGLSAPAWARPT